MRNFARRKSSLPKRGAARWTPLELALIITSVLLIIFPLYAEAYRWISPTQVPAAQLETTAPTDDGSGNKEAAPQATRATFTPDPLTPTLGGGVTDTPTGATSTATIVADTPTTAADTPTTTVDTPTVGAETPTTAVNTPTTGADTPTTGPTSEQPTAGPTSAVPPTTIPTPLIGEAPLTIDKVASVASASINSEYSYSLSVFSDSASAVTAQVTDNLDPQTTFVSASASNGSCSNSGNTVTCSVSVQNNQPAAITIRVRVSGSAQNGGRIRNQASVRDANNNSASSDPVFVEVSGVAPTAGPTSTPDPNQPTTAATPLITAEATAAPTTAPGQPTSPSGGTQPTNTPVPSSGGGGSGGGGGGGGGGSQPTQPVPTAPAPVLLPPTPAVGAAVQPVAPTQTSPARPAQPQQPATRPRATATPVRQNVQVPATQVPAAQATQVPTTQATQAPTATSTPSAPTQIALDPGVFFRMASDWGSVYPGNEVYYVIVFKNNRGADGAALNQLRIASTLPANLEVLSAKADRGDLKQDQNNLSLQVDTLKSGEGIEIGVQARVKQGVAAGTRIISQASAFYDGLALPVYSNIVTVQVVDAAAAANQPVQPVGTVVVTSTAAVTNTAVVTSTAATTSTVTLTATTGLITNAASPTVTTEATAATPSAATNSPTATVAPTATQLVAGGASGSGSLPSTSTGVPLIGFALMGMTLMIRTVRLHRAQTRV